MLRVQSIAVLLILTLSLTKLLNKEDNKQKVVCMAVILMIMTQLAKNHYTLIPVFLFRVLIICCICQGITFTINYQKYSIYVIVLCNGVGIGFAYIHNYFSELVKLQLLYMLTEVLIGFIFIAFLDGLTRNYVQVDSQNKRKIFHLVPMILLPVLHQQDYHVFMIFLAGSTYIFFSLELLRYLSTHHEAIPLRIKDLSLFTWMADYNAERQPHFWFTHLFLIMGLSSTYFYYGTSKLGNISVILASADAFAALIGHRYGKHKFIESSKKSVQGFIAFFICAMIAQLLWFGSEISLSWIIVSSMFCGAVQYFSGDLDNILVPLSYIALHKLF